MSFLRKATHSGTETSGWYSADASVCSKLFAAYFRQYDVADAFSERFALVMNRSTHGPRRVAGIIGPHAGMRFSGPSNHVAYRQLEAYIRSMPVNPIRRVFLLGPSHRKYIRGIEVSQASAYETPFGAMAVDAAMCQHIVSSCREANISCGSMTKETDEDEHSLEMHMPFVAHAFKDVSFPVTVTPILVGELSKNDQAGVAAILAPLFASKENLFVISTDFCHWGSRFRYTKHYQPEMFPSIDDAVRAMDLEGTRHLANRDVVGWEKYLKETGNTICGRSPLSLLLRTMNVSETPEPKQSSSTGIFGSLFNRKSSTSAGEAPEGTAAVGSQRYDVAFVHYAKSGHLDSEADSSVSYASAVVFD